MVLLLCNLDEQENVYTLHGLLVLRGCRYSPRVFTYERPHRHAMVDFELPRDETTWSPPVFRIERDASRRLNTKQTNQREIPLVQTPPLFPLPLLLLADDTPAGQMSGRVGTSLLSALGLDELSFHSVKDLENAAVALAQSPGRLASLRKRLEQVVAHQGGTSNVVYFVLTLFQATLLVVRAQHS